MNLIRVKDYQDMSRKAANIVSAQVILNPESTLGLATGSTPIGMYQQLIKWYQKDDIDFSNVSTVNLDEYIGLPKDHAHSYYRFMQDNFFSRINVDEQNIAIPDGMADDVSAECKRYEQRIESLGGVDLQVLGIGKNGHIGFNEPGDCFERDTHEVRLSQSTIEANSRFFERIEDVPKKAISMGIRTIMLAKRIILLCSGKDKAAILHRSFFHKIDPQVPASILQLHGNITVVADKQALSVIDSMGCG